MSTKSEGWKPVSVIATGRGVMSAAKMAKSLSVTARVTSGSDRTASMGMGGSMGGGPGLPSVLSAGSPLSTFQYTLNRTDRMAMYRYFSKSDPFVGRALELHSELPMSRLTIGPPKGPSPRQNREINRIYEAMGERLDLLPFLLEFSREYWLAGALQISRMGPQNARMG